MSSGFIHLVAWKTEDPSIRIPLTTYINHENEQEVIVFKHKGLMQPRHPHGPDGVHIEAFLPEYGLWRDLHNMPDEKLWISPSASMLIVRYADILFCEGFGEALSKAEWPYNKNRVVWPPQQPERNIIVHGIGTRLIRVLFWQEDAKPPIEFAIRMDSSTDVAPVLYQALSSQSRITYAREIEFWNVASTAWWRLPKDARWDLNPNYTTMPIRARGVGFTPGLGWEITQLERQHGRDRATSVPHPPDEEPCA